MHSVSAILPDEEHLGEERPKEEFLSTADQNCFCCVFLTESTEDNSEEDVLVVKKNQNSGFEEEFSEFEEFWIIRTAAPQGGYARPQLMNIHMGWLRLVGSFKLYISFAEYSLFYRALLQ